MNHRSHSCFSGWTEPTAAPPDKPPLLIQQDARFNGFSRKIRRAQLRRSSAQHPLRNKRGNDKSSSARHPAFELAQDADCHPYRRASTSITAGQARFSVALFQSSYHPVPVSTGKIPQSSSSFPNQCAEFSPACNSKTFLRVTITHFLFFQFLRLLPNVSVRVLYKIYILQLFQ